MIRVRIKNGWGHFDGCIGELVDRTADGDALVLIDGESKPMRFDDTDVEPLDDIAPASSSAPHA